MMKENGTYQQSRVLWTIVLIEIIFWTLIALAYFWVMPSVPGLKLQRQELWWGLLICTGLSGLFYSGVLFKNRALSRFSDTHLIRRMIPGLSTFKQVFKFLLWRIGLSLIVIALINPRYGKKLTEVKYQGIDLLICLDVSNSMLAEDLSPNRMRKAKRAIS